MGGVLDLLRDACGVHKLNLASQLDTILARVHTIRTRMHLCAARTRRAHGCICRTFRSIAFRYRKAFSFLCLAAIGQTLCELRETGGIEWASATIDGATLAPTMALSALPKANGILAIEAASQLSLKPSRPPLAPPPAHRAKTGMMRAHPQARPRGSDAVAAIRAPNPHSLLIA